MKSTTLKSISAVTIIVFIILSVICLVCESYITGLLLLAGGFVITIMLSIYSVLIEQGEYICHILSKLDNNNNINNNNQNRW